jgi:hypothetical protein
VVVFFILGLTGSGQLHALVALLPGESTISPKTVDRRQGGPNTGLNDINRRKMLDPREMKLLETGDC